ncbi:OLF24 protein, partial [Polypterus senegalus]
MNKTSMSMSQFVLFCTIDTQKKSYTIAILTMVYLVTLFGNFMVILVIGMNHKLQKPMYVGIATLAIIDLVGSTNITPKLIAVLLDWAAIPYGPCLLQLLLVLYLEAAEAFLLAFMACDRYVAVVYPLRYSTLVTRKTLWVAGTLLNIVPAVFTVSHLIFIAEFSFCNTNILNYCFCDYSSLIKIACNALPKYFVILSVGSFVFGICPLIFILLSYTRIAYVALKISSIDGKRKTFNTITTHLLVVGLFNIPLLMSYLLTAVGVKLSTEAYNTMIIVANIVPPMFNPVIYSFRNKEIRSSIQKLFKIAKVRSDSPGMNQTSMSLSEFVLLCTIDSQKKSYAIPILTMVYLLTLFGNVLVILAIAINPQLQKPMYVGIAVLAAIDLAGSTNITPKLIAVLSDWAAIPYGPCLLQILLALYLGAAESYLLVFMACDRYVAVVHPLRYSTLVTKRTIWAAGTLLNLVPAAFVLTNLILVTDLSFCNTNILNYCFCDYLSLVKIACNENPKHFTFVSATSFMVGIFPFVFVLLSYARITYAALKISSVDGKRKTFNTLTTHLLVVGLFHVPLVISYVLTGSRVKLSTEAYNTMIIVANILPPMFNPMIYSFRKKEIRNSIQKLFKKL